jgi:hypothetical protein
MRTPAAILMFCALGCGQPAEPAKPSRSGSALGIAAGTIREERWPVQLDVELTNAGEKPIAINGVQLQVLDVMASRPRDASAPRAGQFDYEVTLLRNRPKGDEPSEGLQSGEVVEIPPGTRTISCLMAWRLPPDSPVMIAVVSARLGPSLRNRPLIWSAPVVFLLESEPGVLDALIASDPTDRERAAMLLAAIEVLEGKKSANVERPLWILRELARKPSASKDCDPMIRKR